MLNLAGAEAVFEESSEFHELFQQSLGWFAEAFFCFWKSYLRHQNTSHKTMRKVLSWFESWFKINTPKTNLKPWFLLSICYLTVDVFYCCAWTLPCQTTDFMSLKPSDPSDDSPVESQAGKDETAAGNGWKIHDIPSNIYRNHGEIMGKWWFGGGLIVGEWDLPFAKRWLKTNWKITMLSWEKSRIFNGHVQ